MPPGAEKTIDYFSQYGPWAVLAIILLFAAGLAIRAVYLRMAAALDRMHDQTILMAQQHTAEMKEVHGRVVEVVENNTKAITTFSDRISGVEGRMTEVEKAVERINR